MGSETSINTLGMISGSTPKNAYLASSSATRASRGQAGKRKAAPVRLVHQRRQIFAGDRQRGVRSLVARRNLVVGNHAVDQHVGDAVDRGHQDAPHEQQRQAAGQQKKDLQRRLLVDAEDELEAALADVLDFTSTEASASSTALGTVTGIIGPIIKRELNALKQRCLPVRPAAS